MFRSSLFLSLVAFVSAMTMASGAERPIARTAEATRPVEQGAPMPDAVVRDADGNETTLKTLTAGKRTVLVFFRGGWCPICTRHTGQLIQAYPQIRAKGAQLLAISPDSPESTASNQAKNAIPFPVYSDSDLTAAQAFGLAFQVDEATVAKYQGYGIDLARASGRGHHALPNPSVNIVDQSGKIGFAHSDPDYQQRLDPALILRHLR
jgi:peroxiredoxin